MANKVKKVSINALQKYVNDNYNNIDSFKWNGMDIVVTRTLSFKDMMAFVDSVVKSCFLEKAGTYVPEAKDFAIKSLTLENYANFNMPKDLKERYYLLYNSGAFEEVIEHINRTQFQEMLKAIDSKIENLANINVENVTRQLDDLWNSIEKLESSFANIFSNISQDDIMGLINSITNSPLTEEGLVKAFIKSTKDGD